MHRKTARSLEPLLVTGTREGFEERVTVAGGAVTDARSLLQSRRPRVPRKLGTGAEKLLVEVGRGGDDDSRCACTPLDADLPVRPRQLGTGSGRPVCQAVGLHGIPGEQSGGLTLQSLASILVEQRQQGLDVPDEPVRRREAAQLLTVETLGPVALLVTA